MSQQPRIRVRQLHRPRAELRSASPPGRLRFVEFAPDGCEAATYRGARRVPVQSRLRVRSLFAPLLPAGYPDSVTPDYLPFQVSTNARRGWQANAPCDGATDACAAQLWDSCQGLCSYIRGSFTTAALLRGVGVGSADATAVHATAIYLIRDLCGHAFGLLFAVAAAGQLDAEAKQWRFAADCANSAGYVLELLSPALPRVLFVPAVCAAAVLRAFTGVAAGATRAALTSHFALHFNVADVAAKARPAAVPRPPSALTHATP